MLGWMRNYKILCNMSFIPEMPYSDGNSFSYQIFYFYEFSYWETCFKSKWSDCDREYVSHFMDKPTFFTTGEGIFSSPQHLGFIKPLTQSPFFPKAHSSHGVRLTSHHHLMPMLKNAWSSTSTSEYFGLAWYLIKHRNNFTFYNIWFYRPLEWTPSANASNTRKMFGKVCIIGFLDFVHGPVFRIEH